MLITPHDLDALTARINAVLAVRSTAIKLSVHFVIDRVNHPRNVPPLTIADIEDVLMRFIDQYLATALGLHDHETFNVRCLRTHINMPCEIRQHVTQPLHRLIVITVMRNPNFFSKDRYDFHVA